MHHPSKLGFMTTKQVTQRNCAIDNGKKSCEDMLSSYFGGERRKHPSHPLTVDTRVGPSGEQKVLSLSSCFLSSLCSSQLRTLLTTFVTIETAKAKC